MRNAIETMVSKQRNSYRKMNLKAVNLCFLFSLSIILSSCGSEKFLAFSGTVEAKNANIVSEVSGKVVSILFEEGAVLKKGEIVAEIESAFNFAISSPFPTEEELHNHLYAN